MQCNSAAENHAVRNKADSTENWVACWTLGIILKYLRELKLHRIYFLVPVQVMGNQSVGNESISHILQS